MLYLLYSLIIAFSTTTIKAHQAFDTLLLDDFSNGFAGWTVSALTAPNDTILWEYATNPVLAGTFTGQTIASESVDNGFALLNFDRATGGNTDFPPVINEFGLQGPP